VRRELNVLALLKGQERYVFVYDDAGHEDLLDAFRHYASNPNLSFTWFDAAVLTDKARQQQQAAAAEQEEKPAPRSRIADAG
jgi:hypothetical protein